MPTLPRNTLLQSYAYDPLDRRVSSAHPSAAPLRQFHCKDRLATQIQGTESHSIVQHLEYLLAQQHRRDAQVGSRLMATDQQRSVLSLLDSTEKNSQAYSPFGHCERVSGQLGFNGEPPDPLTRHYALGNGYRTYNPWLMRFQSPDNWSPFGDGGLNCYGYCVGDPINRTDPTGHVAASIIRLLKRVSDNRILATTGLGGSLIAGFSLFIDPEKNPEIADAMLGVSGALLGFTALVGGLKLSRHIGSRRRGAAAGQARNSSSSSSSVEMQEFRRRDSYPPSYFATEPRGLQTPNVSPSGPPPPYSAHGAPPVDAQLRTNPQFHLSPLSGTSGPGPIRTPGLTRSPSVTSSTGSSVGSIRSNSR